VNRVRGALAWQVSGRDAGLAAGVRAEAEGEMEVR
jgi:hypothetical protein